MILYELSVFNLSICEHMINKKDKHEKKGKKAKMSI